MSNRLARFDTDEVADGLIAFTDASPTPFPSSDGTPAVVEVCFDPAGERVEKVVAEGYSGFELTPARDRAPA